MRIALRLAQLTRNGFSALARKSWRANEFLAAAGFEEPVTDRMRDSVRNLVRDG